MTRQPARFDSQRAYHRRDAPNETHGCNCNRIDVVFRTFPCKRFRKPNQTHLGSTIVGLTKVTYHRSAHMNNYISFHSRRTIDPRSTRRINDPPKLLVSEMRPRSLGTRISPLQMYRHNLIELGVGHVLEPIPRPTRTVNHVRTQAEPKRRRTPCPARYLHCSREW